MTGFDPNLPAPNSPISSQELRDQFTALAAQIEDRPLKPLDLKPSTITFSDPPTATQCAALQEKFNQLLASLQ